VRNHFWPFTDVLQKMEREVTRKFGFAVEALKRQATADYSDGIDRGELLAASQEKGAMRNAGITDPGYN
jgi:hypothetical protein